ncbi:unnamed protein product (macronuclear) [Paramecium tetraurelia]|uniref:Cyclic nucleotide-binding domain-containing protein n=1 Tax=Paramecium tetraurelia TaxID=5888 RepID=A0DFA1_PARTE|nr:uncharacterized protein GSPATT00016531001 [Paramecium tetraurelia]CAK81718.1 unnamed protein product [Paramecium tetraurelia]|eukprot:XP_001449115.1 hypothetical protein (macronuclear) [Paramecium tetraurelia strain d4-2]
MLIYLLQKDPEERCRKEHQAIEDQLICLQYFDILHSQTKAKLYKALLRIMAQNAVLTNYESGSLIWKYNDRQDKIMILYSGSIQQYQEMSDGELEDKRKILMKQYKSDIFIERPGRRVTAAYQQNGLLTFTINDQPRLRRAQVCDLPQKVELKRTNSIRHNRYPQLPPQYLQALNAEMDQLLKGIKLHNDSYFQYLLNQCVCNARQTYQFKEGELLNNDLQLKKHNTLLLALSDCVIIQMNLSDYQNVENQIKIQRQSKIYRQLEAGFVSEITESENEMHQLVKSLMSKFIKFKYNPNNTIYQKGQQLTFIYVLVLGECQINDDQNALARVNQGCLLGEESFDAHQYQFKCVTTTKCKLYGVKITDINMLCQRYHWFKQQLLNKKQIKSNWLNNRLIDQQKRKRVESNSIKYQFNVQINKIQNFQQQQLKTHRPTQSQNIFDKNQYQEIMSYRGQFRNTSRLRIKTKLPKQPQSQPSFSKDFSNDIDILPMLMNLDKQQSNNLRELLKKGKIRPYQQQIQKSTSAQNFLSVPCKESTQKILKRIQQYLG